MATAGTVTIKLDGDSATLVRELNKANTSVNSSFKKMRSGAADLAQDFALVAAAAATAFAAVVHHALQSADALAKNADRLGVSTEALGTLQVAAELANVSQEQLVKALQKQQQAIGQAAKGAGELSGAFARLGLNARELAALPVDQQFAQINDALNQVGNTTERNTLRAQIYGGKLAEIGNLAGLSAGELAELDEYLRSVGYTMSRLDTAKLEAANDAIKLAGIAVEGLGNRVTVALAPLIEGVAKELSSSFAKAGKESDGFRVLAQQALVAVGATAGFVGDAVVGIGAVFKTAAGAGLVAFGTLQGAMAAVGKAVETVFINPILGAIEVLLQVASYLPGTLGKSAGEWERIVEGARKASLATVGWDAALNMIGAGMELVQKTWTDTINQQLPSRSIEDWVKRVIKASDEAAARIASAQAEAQQGGGGAIGGGVQSIDTGSILAQAEKAAAARESLERATADEIRRIVITGEQNLTSELGRLVDERARLLTDAEERQARAQAGAEGAESQFEREKELAKNRIVVARDVVDKLLSMRKAVVDAGWIIDLQVSADASGLTGLQAELARTRERITEVQNQRITIAGNVPGLAQIETDLQKLQAQLDQVQTRRVELQADSSAYAEATAQAETLRAKIAVLESQRVRLVAEFDDAGARRQIQQLDAELVELQGRLANPAAVGNFTVDFSSVVNALAQAGERQVELQRQTTEAIRNQVISGETQLSQELLNLIESRAQAVVAAEQRQAELRATISGNTVTFDAEKAISDARIRLANETADQLIAAKQKEAEGGALALPSIDPATIRAQTDAATSEYLAAWQLANEQRLEADLLMQQLLYSNETEAGLALVELAGQQAREKVLAEFAARGAALEELGQSDDPATRAAFEQAVQTETLAREAAFLNERLSMQQQFGARFNQIQANITALFGKQWASAHQGAIKGMTAFVSTAQSLGATLFANNKKVGIANALVSTFVGVAKALELPFPANIAAAAATLAAGMAQVNAARGVSIGGGGGGGGIGSGGSVTTSAPSIPDFGEGGKDQQRQSVVVNINGDLVGLDDYAQAKLFDVIRDAVDGRDLVIFSGSSRQSQVIRSGG